MSSMSKQVKKQPDLLSRVYWNGVIKMSLSKFFILCVLQNRSMHGYDIAREVEKRTNGCCSPTEGAIYPILKDFELGGYATFESEIVSGRERKVYSVTDKGREAFQVALAAWMEVTECLVDCKPMTLDETE
ncbi:PadR family transcriptional regulator [Curvivirga aplysinae]|uniref:PadR family transcriptional regulator n=1 Tax=Curvivirga aplysinae TaxID=2529852 RepID=UPI0012BD11C3|nr:PadR family transcriptional regulator [Curvivirga aplysinae]MTI08941.1 PadR family transcriptional regulator [Curvivirga aplysinae]